MRLNVNIFTVGALKFELLHIMALIYQTSLRQNSGCTLISTHRSVFIDLDVSIGYDQISHQGRPRVRKFEISVDLRCSLVEEILDNSSRVAVQKDRWTFRDLQIVRLDKASRMYFSLQFTSRNPWQISKAALSCYVQHVLMCTAMWLQKISTG